MAWGQNITISFGSFLNETVRQDGGVNHDFETEKSPKKMRKKFLPFHVLLRCGSLPPWLGMFATKTYFAATSRKEYWLVMPGAISRKHEAPSCEAAPPTRSFSSIMTNVMASSGT